MFAGFTPVGVNDKLFYKMTWGPTHLISISKGLPSHCWRWWSTKDDCSREGSYRTRTAAGRDVLPFLSQKARAPFTSCAYPWIPPSLPLFCHSCKEAQFCTPQELSPPPPLPQRCQPHHLTGYLLHQPAASSSSWAVPDSCPLGSKAKTRSLVCRNEL